jgi:nucleoside-diphosphate-sugar epimerase
MHELATLVTRLIATTSTVQYRPLPADDPKLRRPDITLATDLLGWTPTVELPEGLAKTIDWFRS